MLLSDSFPIGVYFSFAPVVTAYFVCICKWQEEGIRSCSSLQTTFTLRRWWVMTFRTLSPSFFAEYDFWLPKWTIKKVNNQFATSKQNGRFFLSHLCWMSAEWKNKRWFRTLNQCSGVDMIAKSSFCHYFHFWVSHLLHHTVITPTFLSGCQPIFTSFDDYLVVWGNPDLILYHLWRSIKF